MTAALGRRAARGWALPVVALSFLAVVRAGILQERDPYWQVRAGLENLSGAPLVRPDSWSWAPVDAPFTQTSPLWNDLLGLAWRTGGFGGFFVVGMLSIWAYGLVVLVLARGLGARPLPALVGVMATLLLALPMLSPRGALAAQTLFLLAVAGSHRALPRLGPMPAAVAVPAVTAAGVATAALGSWLHLSWLLLAPALLATAVVMALLTPALRRRRVALLGPALGAGLGLGLLVGPYGTRAWALSRGVQEAASGVVLEWLPVWSPGLLPRWLPTALLTAAGAGLGLGWVWRHRSSHKDRRLSLLAGLLVTAAPAAVAGFTTIRVVGLALLTLAPVAALGVTRLATLLRARGARPGAGPVLRHPRVRHWLTAAPWRVVTAAVLVLLAPLVVVAGSRLGRPVVEAAALPALPAGCRLVSDANAAGPVLLLRPDVTVWADTRADYWGRERNERAVRLLMTGRDDTGVLARATCAMLVDDPSVPSTGLARALDAAPGWARAYSTPAVTVWARSAAGPTPQG